MVVVVCITAISFLPVEPKDDLAKGQDEHDEIEVARDDSVPLIVLPCCLVLKHQGLDGLLDTI